MTTGKIAALAASILALTLLHAAVRPEFEAASLKPNRTPVDLRSMIGRAGPPPDPFNTTSGRFTVARGYLLEFLSLAYGVKGREIAGAPNWLWTPSDDDFYAIDATAGRPASRGELMQMLQSLLPDRYKLAAHRESREVPGYVLVVARSGPKFKPVQLGPNDNPRVLLLGGHIESRKGTMPLLVEQLTAMLMPWPPTTSTLGGRVVDKTGLTENYDFAANWIPERSGGAPGGRGGPDGIGQDPTEGVSIFKVLEEQLGLRLEQQKVPADILVIDHVERTPAAN